MGPCLVSGRGGVSAGPPSVWPCGWGRGEKAAGGRATPEGPAVSGLPRARPWRTVGTQKELVLSRVPRGPRGDNGEADRWSEPSWALRRAPWCRGSPCRPRHVLLLTLSHEQVRTRETDLKLCRIHADSPLLLRPLPSPLRGSDPQVQSERVLRGSLGSSFGHSHANPVSSLTPAWPLPVSSGPQSQGALHPCDPRRGPRALPRHSAGRGGLGGAGGTAQCPPPSHVHLYGFSPRWPKQPRPKPRLRLRAAPPLRPPARCPDRSRACVFFPSLPIQIQGGLS